MAPAILLAEARRSLLAIERIPATAEPTIKATRTNTTITSIKVMPASA